MKLPIIVNDSGDLLVFESPQRAGQYIEQWAIGKMEAYDGEGRLLRMVPQGRVVGFELAEGEPQHAEKLAGLIRSYMLWVLNRKGEAWLGVSEEWILQAPLHELVRKSLDFKIQ